MIMSSLAIRKLPHAPQRVCVPLAAPAAMSVRWQLLHSGCGRLALHLRQLRPHGRNWLMPTP